MKALKLKIFRFEVGKSEQVDDIPQVESLLPTYSSILDFVAGKVQPKREMFLFDAGMQFRDCGIAVSVSDAFVERFNCALITLYFISPTNW